MPTDPTKRTCACGITKTLRKGYLVCSHCDTPCSRKAINCAFCRELGRQKG